MAVAAVAAAVAAVAVAADVSVAKNPDSEGMLSGRRSMGVPGEPR